MTEFTHPDRALERDDLLDDPLAQTRIWLEEAGDADIALPNAIALGTADADGIPRVRHVLLRGIDERGFTFFTNRESLKGRHLEGNPRAAFALYWRELDRQICVGGTVEHLPETESDAYFASRPRDAAIGAWASPQSEVIEDRRVLESAVARETARFDGREIPRPPYWGGFLIVPETIEFWQGRASRLHDRFRYLRDPGGWRVERLAP